MRTKLCIAEQRVKDLDEMVSYFLIKFLEKIDDIFLFQMKIDYRFITSLEYNNNNHNYIHVHIDNNTNDKQLHSHTYRQQY